MKYIELKDINEYKSESINPAKMQETIFELYSVPVYETGHPEYLTGKEIASSKIVVRKNDILLCKINPRINRMWIVRKESENINIASSEWIVVRNNKYNPEFLAWYFRSPKFRQLMVSEVTGIGGSLTRAQPKRVAKYPVPIMDRIIQDKIVYRLNRIQKIIDMKKKELIKLDLLIQSRFVEMFGDLADPKCVWNQVKLINVCKTPNDVKCGPFGTQLNKNEYQKKGVAVWEIPQINDEFASEPIHFLTEKKAKILESYSVIAGDIVMSRKGNIGKCAVFPEKYEKGIIHSDVLRIRVDAEQVNSQFMMRQLHYSRAIKHQIGTVSSGAIMAGINVTKLKQIYVHIPPIDLQNQFATFVHQVNKSKFVIHKFLYCTTHNTKSIIKPRLNTKESGKIRGGKPHADEF